MKWTIEYIRDQNYVLVITEGNFTLENNQKMTEDVLSREFWKPGLAVLFDHRKLSFKTATVDTMKKAGDNHKVNNMQIGNGKAAILMKSMLDFGRGRQFEMQVEHEVSAKLKIFLNEKEALIWLLT